MDDSDTERMKNSFLKKLIDFYSKNECLFIYYRFIAIVNAFNKI
jgi:hypothetical protein